MEKEKKSINNNLNNNNVKNYVNYLAKINSSENRKEILISKYNTTNKKNTNIYNGHDTLMQCD